MKETALRFIAEVHRSFSVFFFLEYCISNKMPLYNLCMKRRLISVVEFIFFINEFTLVLIKGTA